MNANTRLRLWKEARALLPMWAAIAALMVAPFLIRPNDPMKFSIPAYWFGCFLLGALSFGQEFQHRSMSLLLAHPVSRRRLWWEKMSALGAAQLGLMLLMVLLVPIDAELVYWWHYFTYPNLNWDFQLLVFAFLSQAKGIICAPVLALTTGPLWTLIARSTLGGAALSFLIPWVLAAVAALLSPAPFFDYFRYPLAVINVVFIGGVYCGALLLLGCRRFQRFEDVNLLAQEFAAPRQFNSLFAWLTSGLAPGRDSLMANLLRKELRLQRPAFFVAVFIIVLWLAFIGVRFVRPEVETAILMAPTILLCLGIPVIAGIVSTAEERSLGVHEWHLTLPVSARRLWCAKVLVALGVNAVLGLLLPGLLGHASSWLANNPQLVAEIPGRDVPPFLIFNLVIFCVALYASSSSSNSMRALIGTMVLIVAGGIILTLSNSAASWFAKAIDHSPTPMRDGWWPAPEYLRWLQEIIWPWGVHGALLMLFVFGLENFRRTLDSLRRPVRHVVTLFAVISVLMAYASAWGILGVNYEGAYYELFRGRK